MKPSAQSDFESLVDRWRVFVGDEGRADAGDATREDALRTQAESLSGAGLSDRERFLVALARVTPGDKRSAEFARSVAEEGWSLDDPGAPASEEVGKARFELRVMLACAFGAALAIKLPSLFGLEFADGDSTFYLRNISLFALPFLTLFFAFKNALAPRLTAGLLAAFAASALVVNLFPFAAGGSTELLTALHLPVALWLVAGVAYTAADWKSPHRRMQFVRFTGEWIVHFAMIALGGAVLMALTVGVFEALGVDVSSFVADWMLPCGAMAAVVVAGWLVGLRGSLLGGVAPLLAKVFTPLFTVLMTGLLVGVVVSGGVIDIEREVLLMLDLLLVVVVALLLYAFSARDKRMSSGLFDRMQQVLIGGALVVDLVALANIAARLGTYGFSPNRAAVLGLNLILLANLVWAAVLQWRFLRTSASFSQIEHWQMRYIPVYAAWAAVVAVVFPLLFRFA